MNETASNKSNTINPKNTNAWKSLESLFNQFENFDLKASFANEADRADKYSTQFEDQFLLDYSKKLWVRIVLKALSRWVYPPSTKRNCPVV